MKKLVLLFLFLFSAYASFSQVIPKPNPSAVGIGYKRLLADSTLFIPTGGATPRLGATNVNRRSALFSDSVNKKIWAFYPSDSSWVELGAGGSTSILKQITKAAEDITKGQAVYVSGANGTNMLISKASNITEGLSSKTLGLVEATVATNGFVNVVTEGVLAGLNTSSATIGDPVWLGVNGNLIYGLVNKPFAPANLVFIGVVTRVNSSNGEIFIKVQNGFELRELHDVSAQSPSNNNGLFYNSTNTLWETKSIATALGYTPYDASNPSAYITRTGISAGTGLSYNSATGVMSTTITQYGNAAARAAISLTTTGTSGAATYSSTTGVFNIPNYGSALGNYVSIDGTQTITGAKTFSNTVTLTGTLGNGTYTYTLPSASGTLALTSQIPSLTNYVTLDGAQTISGAKTFSSLLTGTSATFSSTVQASAYRLTGMTAGSGALYYSSAENRVTLANYNLNGKVWIEANEGTVVATFGGSTYNSDFVGTGRFTGALTGASATFSSSVTVNDVAGNYPRFISTVGAKSWEIGYRSGTTNYEVREDGNTRMAIANGGNVLIGTSTDNGSGAKLQVSGAATFANSVKSSQFNLSALNTAPASATATGTTGEIRITSELSEGVMMGFIYVCIATNTWRRAMLSGW